MSDRSSFDRRGARRLLTVVAASALLIGACGNSKKEASTETTKAAAPETTAAAPAPTEAAPETAAPTPDATEPAPADTAAEAATSAPEPAVTEMSAGEFQKIEGVPGVSDEEISFAVLGTGPAANALGYCLLECYQRGVQAYFDYRNSMGGIHGRKLVIGKVVDDEMGNTQVKSLELIDDDSIFGIMGSPLLYTGWADIGKAEVPLYTTFPAAIEANGSKGTFLPTGTGCLECTRRMNVWSAKLAGATKVAVLGLAHASSESCAMNNERTYKKYGPAVGVEWVYTSTDQPFGYPNGLGPQVTAMKEAGVDFVTTCVDQNSVLILEQEMQRQGMTNVKVVVPQGYGDTAFFEENADLLEGDILGVGYRPIEAAGDNAMMAAMLEWTGKTEGLFNDYVIQGWLNGHMAATGLLAAGPQFDRASVIAKSNEITDYTANGMHMPIDWSKGHDAPTPEDPFTNAQKYDCAAYLVVKSGKLELIGDPAKPWYCQDTSTDEWVDPVQMNFT